MNQPDPNLELPPEPSETALGRRELLKALAVSGGVMAVSTVLPGQWLKPVIETGLLPAHALVSATSTATATPTATVTTPVRYTIACSASPNQIFVNGEVTNVQATISPLPPVGTVLEAVFTSNDPDVPGPFVYASATTDAAGVATFASLNLTDATFNPPFTGTTFTLTFRFANQTSFGTGTCTSSVTVTPLRTITAVVEPENRVILCDGPGFITIFSATVSPAPPTGTPVTFTITSNSLNVTIDIPTGTANTDSSGTANFTDGQGNPQRVRLGGMTDISDTITITFSSEGAEDLVLSFTFDEFCF